MPSNTATTDNSAPTPETYLNAIVTRESADACKHTCEPTSSENDAPAPRKSAKERDQRPDVIEIAGKTYNLADMPPHRREYFERLARIRTAPLAAIRLKCFECSGYSDDDAKLCRYRDCSLWILRNNQQKRKAASRAHKENAEG